MAKIGAKNSESTTLPLFGNLNRIKFASLVPEIYATEMMGYFALFQLYFGVIDQLAVI